MSMGMGMQGHMHSPYPPQHAPMPVPPPHQAMPGPGFYGMYGPGMMWEGDTTTRNLPSRPHHLRATLERHQGGQRETRIFSEYRAHVPAPVYFAPRGYNYYSGHVAPRPERWAKEEEE